MIDLHERSGGLALMLLLIPAGALAKPANTILRRSLQTNAALRAQPNASVNWKAAPPKNAASPVARVVRF
jgi:hypothetical protein